MGCGVLFRIGWLVGVLNADAGQEHAGGGERFSRAEQVEQELLLRSAAIAAAIQADSHD